MKLTIQCTLFNVWFIVMGFKVDLALTKSGCITRGLGVCFCDVIMMF